MKFIAKIFLIVVIAIAIMNIVDFRKYVHVEKMDGVKVLEPSKK